MLTKIVKWYGILILVALAANTSVQAAIQVDGLYEIELSVKDQGVTERRQALKVALSRILTRLSGTQAMTQSGQINKILSRASRYVDQYRYRKVDGQQSVQGNATKLLLWVRFNRKAVEQLLRKQQLPLWGSTRPEILLWLGIEDRAGRYILGSDKANPIYNSVTSHAKNLALPVMLPLMDIEDRRSARISDIWGGFSGPVRSASSRYKADNIVIAKLYPDLGGWRSYWTMVTGSREKNWTGHGKFPDQAIEDGLNAMANIMVARYATKLTGELSRYNLVISNINSLKDYNASRQYLASLSLISRFQLEGISKDKASYQIDLRGGLNDLEQVLNLERRLLPDEATVNPEPVITNSQPGVAGNVQTPILTQTETLHYRLKK